MNETDPDIEKPVESKPNSMETVQRFFAKLGPGLLTGAADDDPSGISTYSVTGALFGYMPLWTALFSFPLMTVVQLMCARLGLVTGRGRWRVWYDVIILVRCCGAPARS
jgi:Mn2+/Fe2+ NRAMP family transporter